ncbi:hypothetical protein PENSUB_7436 [Penicillium subrubescens]|jgi:hypothetical protein|uniref:Uncharacterized protein n=1 Tax=Penicillium subrubescens TaxID=1316194 RepID=A0A1Q5TMJ7_9EURO|nr:hypothetical protein PENSUB_7436 [Penicillium subrubescens]
MLTGDLNAFRSLLQKTISFRDQGAIFDLEQRAASLFPDQLIRPPITLPQTSISHGSRISLAIA